MRHTHLTRSISLIVLFSLVGCAALEKHVQKPSVKYAGSQVKSASLYNATIDFLLHVDNPNPVSLPIQGLSYTLDINNKKFLSGAAQHGTRIPANSAVDLSLPIVINYEDFLESLQQLLQQDSFAYTISGELDFGLIKLPYSASGSLPLPKLPQIKLAAFKVKKFSFDGVETVMQFRINNANQFVLNANNLSYEVLLNDIATVSGKNAQGIHIPAQGAGTVEISNKFSLLELGRVLESLRKDNHINTSLKGQLEIPVTENQSKNIPFSWSGQTDIIR